MSLYNYCEENNSLKPLTDWQGSLTPRIVLGNNTLQVWWQCSCGFHWKTNSDCNPLDISCPKCGEKFREETTEAKPRVDLSGQKFGRLTVLRYIKTQKESMWECLCDCGNKKIIAQTKLQQGKTVSCGCFQGEVRKKNFKKNMHFVDGTCIELIASKVTHKTNTSGFRGVYLRENGRYRSIMTFKGKRYELGTYDTFDEAVAARLEGEKMIDEFVEQFRKTTP